MKLFGIGLNKTGTSTLGAACALLGLKSKTWDADLFHKVTVQGDKTALAQIINAYDAFNDFPYPLIYRELDQQYPGSKFVLTLAPTPEKWLASLKAHAMRAKPSSKTHKIVYGFQYPHGHEQVFMDYYLRHCDEVREYFANRPDDFMEVCWANEKDLSRFAGFLGKSPCTLATPIANSSSQKMVNPLRYGWHLGHRLYTSAVKD